MSPEALKGIYSDKSDVWSWAVTVFELYTFGASPYPGYGPASLARFLLSGGRLDQPDGCPAAVYALLTHCWEYDAVRRPSFEEICDRFTHIAAQKSAGDVSAGVDADDRKVNGGETPIVSQVGISGDVSTKSGVLSSQGRRLSELSRARAAEDYFQLVEVRQEQRLSNAYDNNAEDVSMTSSTMHMLRQNETGDGYSNVIPDVDPTSYLEFGQVELRGPAGEFASSYS
eukprot:Opistho-2@92924